MGNDEGLSKNMPLGMAVMVVQHELETYVEKTCVDMLMDKASLPKRVRDAVRFHLHLISYSAAKTIQTSMGVDDPLLGDLILGCQKKFHEAEERLSTKDRLLSAQAFTEYGVEAEITELVREIYRRHLAPESSSAPKKGCLGVLLGVLVLTTGTILLIHLSK
jgi:hypothetical protein